MGLRYVTGIGSREKDSLERNPGPYRDLDDFASRTRLPVSSLTKLAEAGAFESFALSRRDAIWAVKEIGTRGEGRLDLPGEEDPRAQPFFQPLPVTQEILWDYRTSQHSTRGHPMINVRAELERRGIPSARKLNAMRSGKRTMYVGLTICRQQPGTATGVTFYTLEDETGFVNVVVWHPIFEKYSVLCRTALLLGITGKIQSEDGVIHLIAEEVWDPGLSFHPEGTSARSFC
jgi:error-prone DNA polymerase